MKKILNLSIVIMTVLGVLMALSLLIANGLGYTSKSAQAQAQYQTTYIVISCASEEDLEQAVTLRLNSGADWSLIGGVNIGTEYSQAMTLTSLIPAPPRLPPEKPRQRFRK